MLFYYQHVCTLSDYVSWDNIFKTGVQTINVNKSYKTITEMTIKKGEAELRELGVEYLLLQKPQTKILSYGSDNNDKNFIQIQQPQTEETEKAVKGIPFIATATFECILESPKGNCRLVTETYELRRSAIASNGYITPVSSKIIYPHKTVFFFRIEPTHTERRLLKDEMPSCEKQKTSLVKIVYELYITFTVDGGEKSFLVWDHDKLYRKLGHWKYRLFHFL